MAVLGGGGLMGCGIAAEYARFGHAVRITEIVSPEEALARIGHSNVSFSPSAAEAAVDADVVVEALPENLELKRHELAEAEESAPSDAILATNTSSLTVTAIGAGLRDPGRLVGTHFLNPPRSLRIVELVPGEHSTAAVMDRMERNLRSLDLVPIRLKRDFPGFVINRLQFALLREAIDLVDDGVIAARDLDQLMVEGLGRRWAAIGPFATVALGGPAVFHTIATELYPRLSQRTAPTDEMTRLHLGTEEAEHLRGSRQRVLALLAHEHET